MCDHMAWAEMFATTLQPSGICERHQQTAHQGAACAAPTETKETHFGKMHAKGDCSCLCCAQLVMPNRKSWHVREHADVGASVFLQILISILVVQGSQFHLLV